MAENNPEALKKETLVEALRRAGSRTITLESIEADIAAGAPVNSDGTMNIIVYLAWILRGERDAD
jgi:hypothetical protein